MNQDISRARYRAADVLYTGEPKADRMTTLLLSHPACLNHLTPQGHPERPDRLRAIERVLEQEKFQGLVREQAPMATLETIALAHPMDYVENVRDAAPREGMVRIDADTTMSPGSFEAVMRAAGGAALAVDEVMTGRAANAFVATRPAGPPCRDRDRDGLSACSTTPRSRCAMRRRRTTPSASPSWISTCITATAARTFSGTTRA
jgi:hypothetical protein